MDVRGPYAPGDWLDRWGEVVDTYGRHCSNPCHGGYDSDKAGIYGWAEVDAQASIPQGARSRSQLPHIAAATAGALLARFAPSGLAANGVVPP